VITNLHTGFSIVLDLTKTGCEYAVSVMTQWVVVGESRI